MPSGKPRQNYEQETVAEGEMRFLPRAEAPRSVGKISLPPPAPRLIPGHRLDRYELLCPIAQGGMASVWVARIQGVHGFEKLVAIKTILAEYAMDPQYEAMFLNEARLIANIHHHNVAEILDLGSHDSLLYLVLEWIEGDSLALLERAASRHKRPIPVPVSLRIVAQMCAGLSAAHELTDRHGRSLNVVHRDISPQNVLVSVTGEVKLIDFGIAKALDQLTSNTNTGVVKGKIPFMSPEQAQGQPLDARADIWSVGVVLYQLLCGELPFQGTSQLDTLHIIGAGKHAPPIPGLPTVLQRLLDRVLEPDREKRIGGAAELESELERVMTLLGSATTRDLATVVQEHLGSRVAARRETIDTALEAADGRQKLKQVFDAALERERRGDDAATPSPVIEPKLPPVPRVSMLVPSNTVPEPETVPDVAPLFEGSSAQITGVVRLEPPRALSERPARPRVTSRAPARNRHWHLFAIVGAAAFAAAGLIAAFASHDAAAPAFVIASAVAKAPPSSSAAASAVAPAVGTSTAASERPAPVTSAIAATDLPLAAPDTEPVKVSANKHKQGPRAPAKTPPKAPQRDVWSAFSEHR